MVELVRHVICKTSCLSFIVLPTDIALIWQTWALCCSSCLPKFELNSWQNLELRPCLRKRLIRTKPFTFLIGTRWKLQILLPHGSHLENKICSHGSDVTVGCYEGFCHTGAAIRRFQFIRAPARTFPSNRWCKSHFLLKLYIWGFMTEQTWTNHLELGQVKLQPSSQEENVRRPYQQLSLTTNDIRTRIPPLLHHH